MSQAWISAFVAGRPTPGKLVDCASAAPDSASNSSRAAPVKAHAEPFDAKDENARTVAKKNFLALVFCLMASLLFIAVIRRIQFRNLVLVPVVGLMYGSVLTSIAEFYAYSHNILQSMQGWLLGDFSRVVQGSYEIIYLILPIVALAYLYAHRFTVLGMGEGMATSLGLNYSANVALGLLLVAVTVSATVITVGAIPFVGLVIPNLVALRYGDHLGRTLPIVALGGASMLLVCDILGRLLIYPFEVPIGLMAGSVGGVLFLALIIWRHR